MTHFRFSDLSSHRLDSIIVERDRRGSHRSQRRAAQRCSAARVARTMRGAVIIGSRTTNVTAKPPSLRLVCGTSNWPCWLSTQRNIGHTRSQNSRCSRVRRPTPDNAGAFESSLCHLRNSSKSASRATSSQSTEGNSDD